MIYVKIIILLSALCFYLAAAFILKNKTFARYFTLGGVVGNVIVVALNWILNGYVPFVSMFQVLAFLGICFPLSYLYIHHGLKSDISLAWFVLCSAICLTGSFFMDSALIWHQPPALQSVWFLPHVMCYMLSYSLCAVAFVITILMMTQKDKQAKAHTEKSLYALLITGFPFMTMGMFLGAIWANEIWGSYWAWDPKETWALVTWCLYALYFHCRKHKDLSKYSSVILLCAFGCLLMTFIGVNLFGLETVHSYT